MKRYRCIIIYVLYILIIASFRTTASKSGKKLMGTPKSGENSQKGSSTRADKKRISNSHSPTDDDDNYVSSSSDSSKNEGSENEGSENEGSKNGKNEEGNYINMSFLET